MSVNGVPYLSEDDILAGIGEIFDLEVKLISSVRGLNSNIFSKFFEFGFFIIDIREIFSSFLNS